MRCRAERQSKRRLTKTGRLRKARPKVSTTIRLDPEVLDFFRKTGKGWQTRMNDVMRQHVAANEYRHRLSNACTTRQRRCGLCPHRLSCFPRPLTPGLRPPPCWTPAVS
ncbi:TPA: hypothetical protein DCE37_25070 [Candidatus Latescibacteria bacterium]|nr:hypothetical protein [Candidatus Latescibacterota bacterium]